MRIWDYKIKKGKLKPAAERWLLERKLNYGDFDQIKLQQLKTHLPHLRIDPAMRKMLKNFLEYAQ